jgi:hypothetical protein
MPRLALVIVMSALAVGTASAQEPEQTIGQQCLASCLRGPPARAGKSHPCTHLTSKRPQTLHSACDSGFEAGWRYGCRVGCDEAGGGLCFGMSNSAAASAVRADACKAHRSSLPRPAVQDACALGFDKGAEAQCSNAKHEWAEARLVAENEAAEARVRAEAALVAEMEAQLAATRAAAEEEATRIRLAAETEASDIANKRDSRRGRRSETVRGAPLRGLETPAPFLEEHTAE